MITTDFRRIGVEQQGEVIVVSLLDRRIIDTDPIEELGDELFKLVQERRSLIIDFSKVQFLSSEALQKFTTLDKKIKSKERQLRMCNMIPEIYEVMVITCLNQLFDIRDNLEQAINSL